MRRKGFGPGHRAVADPLTGLGELLIEKGAPAEALPVLREALEIRRRALPAGHPDTAETKSVLGGCLLALGRPQEAEPLLVEGDGALVRTGGPQSHGARAAAARLVRLYD